MLPGDPNETVFACCGFITLKLLQLPVGESFFCFLFLFPEANLVPFPPQLMASLLRADELSKGLSLSKDSTLSQSAAFAAPATQTSILGTQLGLFQIKNTDLLVASCMSER